LEDTGVDGKIILKFSCKDEGMKSFYLAEDRYNRWAVVNSA
jgi:hypothetical protein